MNQFTKKIVAILGYTIVLSVLALSKENFAPVIVDDLVIFVPSEAGESPVIAPVKTMRDIYNADETVSVMVNVELSGDQDWIGIYRVGDNNDWDNVIAWNWVEDQGEVILNRDQKPMPEGYYEVRLFFHNEYGANATVRASYRFTVIGHNYGEMGSDEVVVSAYSQDDRAVVYHPSDWSRKTPVIFFAPGWHNTTHTSYETLLTFVASHGYSVIYVPDEGSYSSQLQKFKDIVAEFSNHLDTSKIGVLGHSSGGGFAFWVLDYMSEIYGENGRFLMVFDPYFAYGMSSDSMKVLPSNTNLVILQFGKDGGYHTGNNTDPRIPLSEYALLESIPNDQKDYQVYVEENANHGYVSGNKSYTQMQGALRPLDALMAYTFKHEASAHDVALEVGSDYPLRDGLQELRPSDDYQYACDNQYANPEIDYCHEYEGKL